MAVISGTITALRLLAQALAKKLSKDALKKAVKTRVKKAVKGKIKKKAKDFIKGKKADKRRTAKNIMQAEGDFLGGGALAVSSPTALATTPLMGEKGGALAKVEKKGELIKSDKIDFQKMGQKIDNIAGMTEAVERLTGVQKKQKEDAAKARRIALDKAAKEKKEANLEKKKGIVGKVGDSIKKKAEGPLAMVMRFLGNIIAGGLVLFFVKNIGKLIKTWKSIVEGFHNFFWVIRALLWKGFLPKTLAKGVKAVGSVIVKGFKLVGKTFGTIGKSISNAFGKAGKVIGGWIGNIATKAKDAVVNVAKNAGKWVKNLPGFKQIGNLVNNIGGKVSGGFKAAKGFLGIGAKAGTVAGKAGTVAGKAGTVAGKAGTVAGKVAGKAGTVAGKAGTVAGKAGTVAGKVAGKAGTVAGKTGGKVGGKILKGGLGKIAKRGALKLLGKGAVKTIGKVFGRIPIIGPLMVALASMLSGDPPKQTLFKAMGAALGGLAGSFIPIPVVGTILGEMTGEFVGDLFYTLVSGGGWEGVVEKTKAKAKQIFEGGKAAMEWIGGGFSRFFKNFMEEHSFELPWWVSGPIKKLTGMEVGKLPNILQLYNPLAMGPMLLKSFFPPGESSEKIPAVVSSGEDIQSINNERSKEIDDISVPASYDKKEGANIFLEAPSTSSGGGGFSKGGTVVLGGSSRELLNSYYKSVNVTAPLYKG